MSASTLCAALAVYAVATGVAEGGAQAQISGSTGGDVIAKSQLEDASLSLEAPPKGAVLVATDEIAAAATDGTSNTVMLGYTIFLPSGMPVSGYSVTLQGPRRVRIAADVTTVDPSGGARTERIIAILIGLVGPGVPGFMDYTDDACLLATGGALGDAELRSCAFLSLTFRAAVQSRRLAVSPTAVMAQTWDGIAIWEPR